MSLRTCQCRVIRQLRIQNSSYSHSISSITRRSLHSSPYLRHAAAHSSSPHQSQPSPQSAQAQQNARPKRGLGFLKKFKSSNDSSSDASNASRMILGQSADEPIRARFAPSPTGYLHLGSLRTALFNNITAKATKGGSFILRIEDTDQNRIVEDAEQRLLQDLEWAGLKWDEGPDCGGPHGPYRQSERLPVYKEHVHELLDNGHAYRCFCTSEQLELQKKQLHEAGHPTLYPGTCRSITPEESVRRAGEGEAHVIRFKSDPDARPKLRDAIYGAFQKKDAEEDFILIKTDGFPTYHFANVVDDHLMKITHVIRGEEWLISTPKHISLYEAFGWTPPTFAHLGLLVNPDGTKLSKRNDSVDLTKYKQGPIMPQSLLLWLANLGSSFNREAKTPRTLQEVSDALTFKFTRGGIKLNWEKLDFFNKQYRDTLLRQPPSSLSPGELSRLQHHVILPILNQVQSDPVRQPVPLMSAEYIQKICSICDRVQDPSSLLETHPYLFFQVPVETYKVSIAKDTESLDTRVLDALEEVAAADEYWQDDKRTPMQGLKERLEPQGVSMLTVHNIVRLVGAGGQDVVSQSSGKMFDILGQEAWKTRLARVRQALNSV